ncbi:unnamed protein product [Leptidea sinapis]|uniref:Uncharacterized protein n=1 Tax=Leptidea sinapis TaxID=189913 RepID=A0A5E4Q554_9NEOP|nr:unnamed protein product [Leptidea sinapis]
MSRNTMMQQGPGVGVTCSGIQYCELVTKFRTGWGVTGASPLVSTDKLEPALLDPCPKKSVAYQSPTDTNVLALQASSAAYQSRMPLVPYISTHRHQSQSNPDTSQYRDSHENEPPHLNPSEFFLFPQNYQNDAFAAK